MMFMNRIVQQMAKPLTALTLTGFVGNLLLLCCINMASAATNAGSEEVPRCHSMSVAQVDLDSTQILSTQDSTSIVCCDFANDYLSANQTDQLIGSVGSESLDPVVLSYDRIESIQTLASNCSLPLRSDTVATVPIYLVDCAFLE